MPVTRWSGRGARPTTADTLRYLDAVYGVVVEPLLAVFNLASIGPTAVPK
jgi:hypothetical protein